MNNILKKVLSFFSLNVETKNGRGTLKPDIKNKSTYVQTKMNNLLDKWVKSTHESFQSIKDRDDRYKQLDFMFLNDGYMGMARELYADEVIQNESSENVITVDADKKVKEKIENLIKIWGLDSVKIREIASNISGYGEAFLINSVNFSEGITDTQVVDVRSIIERLEFNSFNFDEFKNKKNSLFSYVNKYQALHSLYDMVSSLDKTTNISDLFKNYLLGFQLNNKIILPPWCISHFRRQSSSLEFWPYGKSLFINSLSLFKQYCQNKNISSIARSLNLPKEIFEVDVPTKSNQIDRWEAVQDAKNEYYNMGFKNKRPEEFGVFEDVWIAKGSISYKMESPNINMDQTKDLELLRDEMITSSRVPKGYLLADKGGFGNSYQSLLYQYKPFGRTVFGIQSIILKEISQLIRLHFLITKEFEEELTPFSLLMNFPVIEDTSDRLRIKSDTLKYAKEIMDIIGGVLGLGRDDSLPIDIAKNILSQFTTLNEKDITNWFKKAKKELEKGESKSNLEKIQEGTRGQKHYYRSEYNIDSSHAQILEMVKTHTKNKKVLG